MATYAVPAEKTIDEMWTSTADGDTYNVSPGTYTCADNSFYGNDKMNNMLMECE